jgi:regulation of enolase protein 1 (concanavalin A-like superfamily)
VGLAGTSYQDTAVAPESTYAYRVRAENAVGLSPYSATASATPSSVTPPAGAFVSADLGAGTPPGSTTTVAEGSAYDVVAGGATIYGTADSFRFTYQQVTGDFDVAAQVTSFTGASDPAAKAGLMARESLAANSRNVGSLATAAGAFRYSRRTATGGSTTSTTVSPAATYPNVWVRLRRVGSQFTTFSSKDGVTWTQTGTLAMTMPQTVYFGMAVASMNNAQMATAKFRNLGPATA